MAFNAGSIEATLTLNRNPFQAGLKAAQAEAQRAASRKYEVKLTPRLDQEALQRIRTTLNRTVGTVTLRPQLDRAAYERIRTTLNRAVGRVTIRPTLDQAAFARIRNTINRTVGRITVRLSLDAASLARVRAQIAAARPVITVRIQYDRDQLDQLLSRLRDIRAELGSGAGSFGRYGSAGTSAFRGLNGGVRAVIAALPLILTVGSAAIQGLIGLVAALNSVFVTLAAGLGAFALVGVGVFKKISASAEDTSAATEAVTEAQNALARANQQAAEVQTRNARSIADAERAVADAVANAANVREEAAQNIADAQRNLADVQRQAAANSIAAARDVEDAERGVQQAVAEAARDRIQAARDIEDAQRSLADAVEQAAQDQADALDAVRDAEQNVVDANQGLADSQRDLTDAIRETKEEYEDFQLSLRDGSLDVEQAQLNLEKAQLDLNEAIAGGMDRNSNKFKQLDLDVRQAALAVDNAKERMGDLNEQSSEWAKTGINGSRRVVDAQRGVQDSIRSVEEAEDQLAAARRDYDRTTIQGQRAIAEAERNLQDARDKAAYTNQQNQERIAASERDLQDARTKQAEVALENQRRISDAERAIQDAREQGAERIMQANRDIGDAERDLAEARQDAAREMQQAQEAIAEATRELINRQKELQDIVGKGALSAEMQKAQRALQRVKDEYAALMQRTEAPVSLAFVAILDAASAVLKTLDPLVVSTANALEGIARRVEEYFGGPHWKNFVDIMSDRMGPVLDRVADIIFYLVRGVMDLAIAFGPLADWMLDKAVEGLKGFAEWAGNISNDPNFPKYMDTLKEAISGVVRFIGALIEFLFTFSVTMAPVGTVILNALTDVFNGLSKLPPEWVGAIAIGLTAVFTALLLGAGGPVALVAGVLVGIATAMGIMYDSNEKLRGSIDGFVSTIRNDFAPIIEDIRKAWDEKVIPVWQRVADVYNEKLAPVFDKLWTKLRDDVLPVIGRLADTIFGRLIPAFGEFLIAIEPFVTFMVEQVGGLAVDALRLLLETFDYVLNEITLAFEFWAAVFEGDWETAWKKVQESFGLKMEFIELLFGDMFRQLGADLEKLGGEIAVNWNSFWDGLRDWGKTTNDQMNKDWADYWLSFGARQDETQAERDRRWKEFWTGLQTWGQETNDAMNRAWDGFWGQFGESQLDAQSTSNMSWQTFWGDLQRWAQSANDNMNRMWNDFWRGFGEATRAGVDAVGQAFRRIGNFFRDPINWTIEWVFNRGILGSWNTVMGWIGAPGLSVPPIPFLPAFADGGPIDRGKYGVANKDSVPIMTMPGEYVLSKRAIANMGGLSAVHQMHESARAGSLGGLGVGRNDGLARQHLMRSVPMMDGMGKLRGYAYGGVQPHVAAAGQEIERVFGRMPGGIGGVGQRSNASDHPSGHALDFMTMSNLGLGDRVAAHLLANAQRMMVKYLIWRQAINSGSGWRGMEDRGSITANHFDHVHASFLRAGGSRTPMSGGGELGTGSPSFMGTLWDVFGGAVRSLFQGALNFAGMPGAGSPVGNAITQIPLKAVDIAISRMETLLTGMANNVIDTVGSWFGGGGQAQAVASRPGYYDKGGVLFPGINPVNTTGGMERVLDRSNSESFDQLVAILEDLVGARGMLTGDGASGDTFNVYGMSGSSVRELADHLDFKKRVRGKGKYR